MSIKLNPIKIIIISILSITVFIGKVSALEETININGLSGDYSKEDYNNSLVPMMSNIENYGTEGYVEKIQTVDQEWEDLNLYIIDSNGDITHKTLMDRNMGATETYNQEFNTNEINTGSFGYHYQRGNKYGFRPCISLGETCNTFPGGEIIAENGLWNVIRKNFIGTFANNVWNNSYIIEDYPYEYFSIGLLGYSHTPYSKRIRQQMGENLWGGYGDTKASNGNGSFEGQDILNNTIQSHADRQGPCPNGYYIPSVADRNEIFTSWADAKNFSSTINENTYEEIFGKQFSSDLLLPPAGIRGNNSNIQDQGIKGAYRTSSPDEYYIGDTYNNYRGTISRYLMISKSYLGLDDEYYGSYEYGLSLRCIKNTNQGMKIYPNGGTNAIIITVGDKITTLSNPSKNGCTFGGRYTNPDFSEYNVISQGDEIYDDITLYAKWIGENCGQINTQQENCTGLPNNAQWINSKFTQTWDGFSRIPSSHENTYTSDSSVECSFQCNTNYTRDSNSRKCIANTQKTDCNGLPNNAQWINSKFTQTWNGTSRIPSSHKNTYTTDNNIECSFQCSTNYSRNNSSKSCEYNGSSGGGGGGGGSGGGGGGGSSSKNNYIDLSTNRESPSTSQYINLTIETDEDYTGKIKFSRFQYRSSSSSSWSTISRTSSTYVSDYSSPWSNGYYKMTSSDDGYITLKNLIKFKKAGYYKICIEDIDYNSDCIQINVGTSSSSNNYNLSISASPSNPDTYEWIKLTITTDDDYTGKIKFSKFQYRSSSSSSWSTISSRTSSTYVSDYSSAWSNGYYKMTSSDDGETVLKNLVKFKKAGYYRIYIEDSDGNESYVQINVDDLEKRNNGENENYNNGEDIESLINRLINGDFGNNTNSNGNSQNNTNQNTNESNQNYNTNQNNNSLNETYISRSCKPYTIEYIQSLNAYTSPELKKREYFINTDYFKRYIDSKNAQNIECPSNGLRISTSYTDTYTGNDHVVAPNGKIYFITQENGNYTSDQLNTAKRFSNVNELKNYIKNHNPLTKIN